MYRLFDSALEPSLLEWSQLLRGGLWQEVGHPILHEGIVSRYS